MKSLEKCFKSCHSFKPTRDTYLSLLQSGELLLGSHVLTLQPGRLLHGLAQLISHFLHLCLHVFVFLLCVCVCVHTCKCMCTYVHVFMYACVQVHVYICTCFHVCVCACICTCVCVCVEYRACFYMFPYANTNMETVYLRNLPPPNKIISKNAIYSITAAADIPYHNHALFI